jgi:hypothetical protein
MNILDPIFYRTWFYDFRPMISPGFRRSNSGESFNMLRKETKFMENAKRNHFFMNMETATNF